MRIAAWVFATAVLGCGAGVPEGEPTAPVEDADPGDAVSGTATAVGDEEATLSSEGTGNAPAFALERPACEVRPSASGPQLTPCAVRSFYASGVLARVDRFDEAGRAVSSEAFTEKGAAQLVTTTTYRSDGQPQTRTHNDLGSPSFSYRSRWYYDGEGVLRRVDTQQGPNFVTTLSDVFGRDAAGRVTEIRTYKDGVLNQRFTNHYDASGRIVKTWRSHIARPSMVFQVETFEFHPGGALAKKTRWVDGPGGGQSEERFDVEGRPVWMSSAMGESGGTSLWRYGGKLGLRRVRWSSTGGSSDQWDETDSAARPLRTLRRYASYFDEGRVLWEHHRYTYICGTDKLLREELDWGNDGRIDGAREWTYDPAGNLVAEAARDDMKTFVGFPRVEYDYSCH